MGRRRFLARSVILGVSALAFLVGCDPADPDGGCWFSDCGAYLTASGDRVDCCQLDLCNATTEQRLACCACDPGSYCAPNVPCDLATAPLPEQEASSCMSCHNGSDRDDYLGYGLLNPHPFPGARFIACETCHGGDPSALDKDDAHVPRPIEILDDLQLANDAQSYEYFRTHAGVENLSNYQVGGRTFSPIDWLQFVNPGAATVVAQERGCATSGCHVELGAWMATSIMTTGAGVSSALMDHAGVENAVVEHQAWYDQTAADYGFRAAEDPGFAFVGNPYGQVGTVLALPILDYYQVGDIFNNPVYTASTLDDDVIAVSDGDVHQNQLIAGSPLRDLVVTAADRACGQCHLGDRGGNVSAALYRSSGCSACHMEYALSGRSRSRDPNVQIDEPVNPDRMSAPEDSHPSAHRIVGAAKVLPSGDVVQGVDDIACGTCHRETNDTMLQFWGVRVDRSADVTNDVQYPANPWTFSNAANEQIIFDPGVQNQTFQGHDLDQLLSFEDYDGDGRDDIPADIHFERGLACIDCHRGSEVHNGAQGDGQSGALFSRAEQVVAIACESCHGGIDEYAATTACTTLEGEPSACVLDRRGNAQNHVFRDEDNQYWLRSLKDGRLHYLPQTRDVVVDSGRINPLTNQFVYNANASYAMGRADGDPDTGIGPQQVDGSLVGDGFSHSDRVDCVACHASWTNQRFGKYMNVLYDINPQNVYVSKVDGERVSIKLEAEQAAYSNPVPFFLGVGSRGLITQTGPELQLFFQYGADLNGDASRIFTFSDRRGDGSNPDFAGRGPFGALGHGRIMAHTIRGRPNDDSEGARQCVACHLNVDQITDFGADYQDFLLAMSNSDIAALNYNLLDQHIGLNTGNELNSPMFVHMAAGLGTGLWYFDADGCPVNPLDASTDRITCGGIAPVNSFDPARVAFALDQPVTPAGVANASGHRPAASATAAADIAALRDGANNPDMPGPLGATLSQKLADPNTGLILDSWIDANGNPRGQSGTFL